MNKLVPRLLLGLSLCVFTLVGAAGCHSDTGAVNAAAVPDNSGPDPANANLAPVDNNQPQPAPQGAVLGIRSQAQPQQVAQSYAPQYPPQQAAPPDQDQAYQDAQTLDELDADGETQPVEYAAEPPPPLPVYEQPEIPAPNYIWVPGYWGWGPGGYYWIPGYWCAPPYYGALWTPGYWGWYRNRWGFHRGFWGLHIGFYGGINYGFGYTGFGYYGGYWNGNHFYYNRSVNRIGGNITYVYNRTVVVNNNTRIGYNGGRGGITVRPRPAEIEAMRGPRTPPMSTQLQNQRVAAQNRQQFFNVNKGRPAMVAAPRPVAAQPGIVRPNPGASPNRPGEPNNRPAVQTVRLGQPEIRPVQPGNRPGESNDRPQVQPVRPSEPQIRPVQPQQPRPVQPEVRPVQPQPRPSYQSRPEQQVRPQPEIRPVQPQPTPQPRPQPEQRPAQQPQPRPQPQARPEQSRPAPQAKSEPHEGDRPH